MCIIVYKPSGQKINKATLRTCFQNNPHGAGYMFPCEGKVLIRKGFFTFSDFWTAWEKTERIYGDTIPIVFHFRIATAGEVDKTNCHPHRITKDLAFVHNGILDCVDVPKKSRISDTILYRDVYLRTMNGNSIREEALFLVMGEQIGSYNKFVFMNGRGEVAFANEDSGLWADGVWYSNTTFRPKAVTASKSKKKGTTIPETTRWTEYNYCEYCGKDLDSPNERAEGLCFSYLGHDVYGFDRCGGCDCVLADSTHKLAGWCDDCGSYVYGDEWDAKLDEYRAEEAEMEGTFDELRL